MDIYIVYEIFIFKFKYIVLVFIGIAINIECYCKLNESLLLEGFLIKLNFEFIWKKFWIMV